MQKKPNWIPDWQDQSLYPDLKTTTLQQWAWEFLRRSPLYQQDFAEFERIIEPDILRQAKTGIITKETAQIVIQYLKEYGKDSLIPISKISADNGVGGCEEEPECELWLPLLNGDFNPLEKSNDNLTVSLRKIKEPNSSKHIRDFYGVYPVRDPASSHAPLFRDETHRSFVPLAVSHIAGVIPQYLQPETENEIAFMVDLKKPIKEQISFIKELCIELQIKTKNRISKPKKIEWQRQLRLLDAIKYGPRDARKLLAKEWHLQINSLSKKLITAIRNREAGFLTIVSSEKSTLNSDPKNVASQIELTRSLSKIELAFDKDIDPNGRHCEAERIKQEGLKRLRTKLKKQ